MCLSAGHTAETRRLALVIGNDNYQHIGKLEKAGNDASAMARELKAAGFEVDLKRDVNYRSMSRAIDAFVARISGGDQVVVFYAGHGVQIKSGNYLLPTDLEKGTESEIERFSYSLDDLTAKLSEAKASFSLVMVDACRNNPIKVAGRSIGASRGLSPVEPPKGQMVVFSASRGQEALDKLSDKDNHPNGVFTREFISRMKTPGIKIQDLMVDVQDAVEGLAKSIGHDQRPALYNESRGNFYFYGGSPPKVTINNTPLVDPEVETWNAAVSTNSLKAYQAYLNVYPTGKFTAAANIKIESLQTVKTPVITQPVTPVVIDPKQPGYAVGFLNATDVIKVVDENNEKLSIDKANKIIKDIAISNSLEMVLQDYFWVSPQLDITDRIIPSLKSGIGANLSLGSFPKVKYAYLNRNELFSNTDLKNRVWAGVIYKTEETFLQAVLKATEALSNKLGFNVVVTEAVWVKSELNITKLIEAQMSGAYIDYQVEKKRFVLGGKMGFVEADNLFTESTIANRAKSKLTAEFSKRENELQQLSAELKMQISRFDVDKSSLSTAQIEKRQEFIKNENTRYLKRMREFQEDLNARKNDELAKVIEVSNTAIRLIASGSGYDIIFQECVYVNPQFNITPLVLKHALLQ